MPPPGGAPSGGGGGQSSDNSMGYIWIIVGLFVAGWALWYFCHDYIVAGYLGLKSGEITLVSFFSSKLDVIKHWISVTPSANVTFTQITEIATLVGNAIIWPIVVIMTVLTYCLYKYNPIRAYRKTYNMKKFAKQEADTWPLINPVVNKNLGKENIDKGPWAMSVTPMMFAKKNDLLIEAVKPRKEGELSRKDELTVTLDRGKTMKFFAFQLGPLWMTTARLPIHVCALFAIFAARINDDRDVAEKLLRQFAVSSTGKVDFAGVREIAAKYEKSKPIKEILSKHAYMLTVLSTMLERARSTGVLASSEILWLKPMDRRMWYMLNNVGRKTAFVEVAGPFAHWVAEKEYGQPIISPCIEEAGNALELAISEVIYQPDKEY